MNESEWQRHLVEEDAREEAARAGHAVNESGQGYAVNEDLLVVNSDGELHVFTDATMQPGKDAGVIVILQGPSPRREVACFHQWRYCRYMDQMTVDALMGVSDGDSFRIKGEDKPVKQWMPRRANLQQR